MVCRGCLTGREAATWWVMNRPRLNVTLAMLLLALAGLSGCAVQLDGASATSGPGGEVLPRANRTKAMEYFAQGNELLREERYKKAIKRYSRALKEDPSMRDAYVNRGIAHMAIARFDRALPDFAEALEIGPADADLYFNLGNGYSVQAQWAMAIKCYEQALEMDPSHEGALNNLGNALGSADRTGEAMAVFERYVERFPDRARGYNNLGVALEMASQTQRAETAYSQAIEAEPDSVEAYLNLGDLRRKNGDACGAMRLLAEYVRRVGDRDEISSAKAQGVMGTLLQNCPSGAALLNELP